MNDFQNNAPFDVANDTVEAFRYQFENCIRNMYAALPVQVVSVQAAGLAPVGFVDLQPLTQQVTIDGNMVSLPAVFNAPYFRLQGGTNAIIIDPAVGDIGIAVFSSRDTSGVKRERGKAATASLRMFSLSDGMYIGGILNAKPEQYIQFDGSGIAVYSPTAINLTAPTVTINAAQQTTVDTPLLVITGQMTQTGAKGSGAQTSGGLTNTGGTISSNGIVLESHVHGGVQSGGSNTGTPV